MLVAISDLHLDDGTCGKSLSADAFHTFRERLEHLAFSASLRADGTYRPIDNIDLLLLGDIFELIHSTLWLKEGLGKTGLVRPWIDPDEPVLAQKIQEITQAILIHNAESMSVLRQMADGEAIFLPPANAHGSPALDTSERIPIHVNIYYMVGNHDWFYHLPREEYHHSRRLIIDAMGLQNTPAPFLMRRMNGTLSAGCSKSITFLPGMVIVTISGAITPSSGVMQLPWGMHYRSNY
jgi:UDP-2,3-diacylglucosamine pyrophosphatase LpxH